MTFAYREVTVSGIRYDTEGTSKAIKEIEDVMVNDMGWVLEEDSTTLAGSNHKLIMHNNGGESGLDPNFYLIMTSGTTNQLQLQVSTAWTAGSPGSVPGSGTVSPLTTPRTVATDEDGNFKLWISGDKDAVNFVTNPLSSYQSAHFGRAVPLLDTSFEPYAVYLIADAGSIPSVESASAYGLISNNPIIGINANSDTTVIAYSTLTTNEPYNLDDSQDQPFYTALPYLWLSDNTSPLNKGAIGLLRNVWRSTNLGIINETVFTNPANSEEFIGFDTNTTTILIRKSL